ncbi:MAG TPA: uracil-DNA glycosylase family protein [Candidatus Acidoferrales bacterium]|nr:uracil-DNA glycosylase family protein [Candidatus Acidoferrales bacterium]
MDPAKIERVEPWLRFADELGLGPYFRNRADRTEQASGGAGQSAFAVSEPPVPPIIEAASAKSSQPGKSAAAPPAINSPAINSKVQPGSARSPLPAAPAASGSSLFEAFARIESDTIERIRADIGPDCRRCKLHKARTKIVFGVGNPKAQLVFVGEGPGHDEDVQGEPFVGRAGKLLTQMIEAMSLRREDVYICNVVKCRPPENRLPEKDEIATCSPYLLRQLDAIQPRVICCLGACAAQSLLQTAQGISRFRGEWFDWRGSKLIATYHPAYLLRNPPAKAEVWKDLQKVMALLGLEPRRR